MGRVDGEGEMGRVRWRGWMGRVDGEGEMGRVRWGG